MKRYSNGQEKCGLLTLSVPSVLASFLDADDLCQLSQIAHASRAEYFPLFVASKRWDSDDLHELPERYRKYVTKMINRCSSPEWNPSDFPKLQHLDHYAATCSFIIPNVDSLDFEFLECEMPRLPVTLRSLFIPSLYKFDVGPKTLPDSLRELEIGFDFQGNMLFLPNHLEKLEGLNFTWCNWSDNCEDNHTITCPPSMRTLGFSRTFNKPIRKIIGSGLESITFEDGCDFAFPELPATLSKLYVYGEIEEVKSLPLQLQTLWLMKYPHVLDVAKLPPMLRELRLGTGGNHAIDLTCCKQLEDLAVGKYFNSQMVLPASLRTLEVGHDFNQVLVLPQGLTSLVLGKEFNSKLEIPPSLTSLELGDDFDQTIFLDDLPTSLTTLRLGSGKIVVRSPHRSLVIRPTLCFESDFYE